MVMDGRGAGILGQIYKAIAASLTLPALLNAAEVEGGTNCDADVRTMHASLQGQLQNPVLGALRAQPR
eukprot:1158594-Pelagomonas_calceolata.AAC.2